MRPEILKARSGVIQMMYSAGPIPNETLKLEWPPILVPLKRSAKEGDRGAGDIIARVIGPIGGDVFKKWYKTIFGTDCGCGNRQEVLNQRWPL